MHDSLYAARIRAAVGISWDAQLKAHPEERPPGTVRLDFLVTPAGAVRDVRVTAGREHRRLVALGTAALREAKIPPMPAALRRALPAEWAGNLGVHFDFTALPAGVAVPRRVAAARAQADL